MSRYAWKRHSGSVRCQIQYSKTNHYVRTVRSVCSECEKGSRRHEGPLVSAAKTIFVVMARRYHRQIAGKADVAVPTVYALYKSKEGILREVMSAAIFGQRFQAAKAKLEGVTDPVKLIALTAHVARAIYEGESLDLGLMRGASAFSPALRKLEQEFERNPLEMQEERVRLLFAQAKETKGLGIDEARRISGFIQAVTSPPAGDESGWTPDRYQRWLSDTLVNSLVSARARKDRSSGLSRKWGCVRGPPANQWVIHMSRRIWGLCGFVNVMSLVSFLSLVV